ncbi:hypothetical protein BXY39_3320 [Eilatimonas milleporae]|uniref:Uncharacterized protein n=1 Tax=Eilatimonas milleporae TaxID=911205 RepID=A0A3M0CFB7_9PROT|nr:hypothetical protein BXY39_3320 [Eilatimonas milleporae]
MPPGGVPDHPGQTDTPLITGPYHPHGGHLISPPPVSVPGTRSALNRTYLNHRPVSPHGITLSACRLCPPAPGHPPPSTVCPSPIGRYRYSTIPHRPTEWGRLRPGRPPPSTACPSPIGPYRRLGGASSAHRLPPLSTARPSPIGPYRRTGWRLICPPPVPVSAPPTGRPLLPRLSPPASARLRAVGHHCCLWGPLPADGSLTACCAVSLSAACAARCEGPFCPGRVFARVASTRRTVIR